MIGKKGLFGGKYSAFGPKNGTTKDTALWGNHSAFNHHAIRQPPQISEEEREKREQRLKMSLLKK